MADRSSTRPETAREPIEIDTGTAHTSRMYDYLLGGTDNFAVDREVAHHAFAAYPGGGFEAARADARANRAFSGRVVRFLAGDVGIRQFLDIGTGIPGADNVHAVVREVAPDARVVYVDNDPIVLAHAHSLLDGVRDTRYVDADLRHPGSVLRAASDFLDLDQPVAVLLVGILHVIPDEPDPYEIVSQLVDALVPGSYLAATHLLSDVESGEMAQLFDRLQAMTRATNPPAFRPRAGFARFFDGLELIEPGVVPVRGWRPEPEMQPVGSDRASPLYAAVARKP